MDDSFTGKLLNASPFFLFFFSLLNYSHTDKWNTVDTRVSMFSKCFRSAQLVDGTSIFDRLVFSRSSRSRERNSSVRVCEACTIASPTVNRDDRFERRPFKLRVPTIFSHAPCHGHGEIIEHVPACPRPHGTVSRMLWPLGRGESIVQLGFRSDRGRGIMRETCCPMPWPAPVTIRTILPSVPREISLHSF